MATVMAFGATAFAAETPKHFIKMGEVLIDGKIAKPAVMYWSKRERLRWKRLLNLKKSFRQTLIDSYTAPELK